MGYKWNTYYYFQSHRGTSNLFLNREGSGAIANNQNLSIYKSTGSGVNNDHRFKLVEAFANSTGTAIAGCTIRSALNSNYGLNIYGYGSSMTAEGNCDLYPVGGQYPNASNYADSLIDLQTVDASQNLYRITLIKHKGLYLTPVGNYNNANVRWMKATGGDEQVWKLCDSENGGSTGGGTLDKNYLTYPTKTMRLTQGYNPTNSKASHYPNYTGTPADYPIDEGCADTGKSAMYCPCDKMLIKRIYGNNDPGTNTIWLESAEPVIMPCGTDYVTMMVLHVDDSELNRLYEGKSFVRGEEMFVEGTDGGSTGTVPAHFHISIGKGKFTGLGWTLNNKGNYVLSSTNGAIKPEQGFYIDQSFTTVANDLGYAFQYLP